MAGLRQPVVKRCVRRPDDDDGIGNVPVDIRIGLCADQADGPICLVATRCRKTACRFQVSQGCSSLPGIGRCRTTQFEDLGIQHAGSHELKHGGRKAGCRHGRGGHVLNDDAAGQIRRIEIGADLMQLVGLRRMTKAPSGSGRFAAYGHGIGSVRNEAIDDDVEGRARPSPITGSEISQPRQPMAAFEAHCRKVCCGRIGGHQHRMPVKLLLGGRDRWRNQMQSAIPRYRQMAGQA